MKPLGQFKLDWNNRYVHLFQNKILQYHPQTVFK